MADFNQIVKVEGNSVRVHCTIKEQMKEGKNIRKEFTAVDDNGEAYTGVAISPEEKNYETRIIQILKT